jgi:4-amino-4-deoxy-L-arabinose transferase-like glycosyltransferase
MDHTKPSPATNFFSRIRLMSGPKTGDRTAGQKRVKRITSNVTLSSWSGRLGCIFALALIIRAVFVLSLQNGFYFPDSVGYSRAAQNLITHGEFGETYRRSPGYPLFLAGIYTLFGQEIVAIRLVEAVMGACLAVVMATMARRIGGEHVGGLAGLLWSIYPVGIFIAGLVYPTGLATTLLACGMLCMVTKADQELAPGPVLLGGIFLGLAALTIPVALATVISTTLWLVYWQRGRRLLLTALFLFGVALALTPWTVRNFYVYGRLVIVEPRLVERIDMAQQAGMGEKSADQTEGNLEKASAIAGRFVHEFRYFWELSPHRIQMNWPTVREKMHEEDARIVRETVFSPQWARLVSVLSVGPVFLFALIGTAAMGFQKERRPHLFLLCGTILSFAIAYSFFFGKMRYRVPVEPYIIILSAYGLRSVWLTLAGRLVPKALSMWEKAEL